jgi:hypothetical protein
MRCEWLLFGLLSFAPSLLGAASPDKKVIEFGWDEPDTSFLRQHIAEMEQTPFDGCVFHVEYAKLGGGKGSFTWESWGTRAFTAAELQGAVDDLKATRNSRFRHNFLRFNTTPAKLDWFDDYSANLDLHRNPALVVEGRHAREVAGGLRRGRAASAKRRLAPPSSFEVSRFGPLSETLSN